MRRLFVLAALLFALPAHAATVVINNGLAPPNPANVIDSSDDFSADGVLVENVGCDFNVEYPCTSIGVPTTVGLVSGGRVGHLFAALETSAITMSGGSAKGVVAQSFASIEMSGGSVDGDLSAWESSSITMSDGFVGGSLAAYGSSYITMSGGLVTGESESYDSSFLDISSGTIMSVLQAYDSSSIMMSGGLVTGQIQAYESSSLTVSGGSVESGIVASDSSSITISGGFIEQLLVTLGPASITLMGGDFAVDGVPVSYGDVTAPNGALTGVLASGDSLDIPFSRWGGGVITLVPEPSIACIDGIDNDYDGLIDYPDDPGCADALDLSERDDTGTYPCDDANDNDGDGLIDYPDDVGCADASDQSEETDCDDGIENDGDGTIDWNGGPLGEPADPGCANADDLSERNPNLACDDGSDNDGDTLIDYPNDPGCWHPASNIENPQCQDGINNDPHQDGWIDFDGGVSAGVPPEWQTAPDPQCVGMPWKNWEARRVSSCGIGVELALLLPALMWMWRRRRQVAETSLQ